MPRTANEVALELSLLKMLKGRMAEKEAALKAELQSAVPRGTVYATLPEGGEVGTVVVVADGTDEELTLEVYDTAAFLAYVKEVRPTAVEEKVRESDKKSILAKAAKDGDQPPGTRPAEPRKGYVQLKAQTKAQEESLLAAWRERRLEVDLVQPEALPTGVAEPHVPTEPFWPRREARWDYLDEAIEAVEGWNCSKGCKVPSEQSKELGPGGDCPILVRIFEEKPMSELQDDGETIVCTKREPLEETP